MEASVKERTHYLELISGIEKDKLVYIDESGIERNAVKDRGWGKKGKPLGEKRSSKAHHRINIIAGLVNNKSIAPLVFSESCNLELFNNWVEHFLVQELHPGQVVVMDNATFHKSQTTKQLIEGAGCQVIFLPPYSPDLNPIEKFWANMKRWVKSRITAFYNIKEAISDFFLIT